MKEKRFCKVHSIYYTGVECPYCFKDRMDKMLNKYDKPTKSEKKNDEPSQEALQMLMNKFNR